MIVERTASNIIAHVDEAGSKLELQEWYDTLELVIERLAERLQNAGEDLRGKR
jgi:hypothetical protein